MLQPRIVFHQACLRVPEKLRAEPDEWLGYMVLLKSGRLGKLTLVARGTAHRVEVDPALLFRKILAPEPQGFLLFHNHPSGCLDPSPEDWCLTHRAAKVAELLGIQFLGHGIVTVEGERNLCDGLYYTTPI